MNKKLKNKQSEFNGRIEVSLEKLRVVISWKAIMAAAIITYLIMKLTS